jgi:hypothetical protein
VDETGVFEEAGVVDEAGVIGTDCVLQPVIIPVASVSKIVSDKNSCIIQCFFIFILLDFC